MKHRSIDWRVPLTTVFTLLALCTAGEANGQPLPPPPPMQQGVLAPPPPPAPGSFGPPPTYVATTEPVYFEGHAVYWYAGHWYWWDQAGWHWYEGEPAFLRDRRMKVPAQRYHYAPQGEHTGDGHVGTDQHDRAQPGGNHDVRNDRDHNERDRRR